MCVPVSRTDSKRPTQQKSTQVRKVEAMVTELHKCVKRLMEWCDRKCPHGQTGSWKNVKREGNTRAKQVKKHKILNIIHHQGNESQNHKIPLPT